MNEQGFTSGRPLSSVLLGFRNVDREAKDAILVSLSSPSVLVTLSFLFLFFWLHQVLIGAGGI